MGPISYVMVLMGCAAGSQCEPVATLPAAYRNEAKCLAAREEIVAASAGLGFDRVYAECRRRPSARSAAATFPRTA